MCPGIAITTESEGTRSSTQVPETDSTTADITHPKRSMTALVEPYFLQVLI